MAIGSTVCVLTPKPEKLSFWKPISWKSFFMHIWIAGRLIPNPFLLQQVSLDVWEVCIKCHGYRINLVFESIRVEKAIFMHIWITGSPITIPFLHTTLFRCVVGVRYVSWIADLRFSFWPPKPKNLVFESIRVKKAIFIHIWITGSPITIPFSSYNFI